MFLQHQKSLLMLFYLALRWPGGAEQIIENTAFDPS